MFDVFKKRADAKREQSPPPMSIDDDFFSDAPAPKPTAAGRHVPSRSSSGEGAGAG